jgi:gliding motility-associated-like protein
VALGSDTLLCAKDTLIILANVDPDSVSFHWYDQSSDSQKAITQQGVYWLEASNQCATVRDSIFIDSVPRPEAIQLPEDTFFCEGDTVWLDGYSEHATAYQWSHDTLSAMTAIVDTGSYWIKATNRCGEVRDTVNVREVGQPVVVLPADTILCAGDTLEIIAITSDEDGKLTWMDGSEGEVYQGDTSGSISVSFVNECGIAHDSMELTQIKLPEVQLGSDTTLCPGGSINFRAADTSDHHLWSTRDTGISILAGSEGLYWLESSNECGARRDSMFLSYYPIPQVQAGDDTTIARGTAGILYGEGEGALFWNAYNHDLIECDTCPRTSTTTLDTSTYFYLKTTDENGCTATDSMLINVKIICNEVMLPNAFTPNGDGLNDEFKPLSKTGNQELIEMRIYNRWGELIFRTTEMTAGWDGTFRGKTQDPAVYTYVLRYECKGEEFVDKGNVTLIR